MSGLRALTLEGSRLGLLHFHGVLFYAHTGAGSTIRGEQKNIGCHALRVGSAKVTRILRGMEGDHWFLCVLAGAGATGKSAF
jgi:hypothetical protein